MIEEPAVLVVGWTTTVFDRVSGLDRSLESTWLASPFARRRGAIGVWEWVIGRRIHERAGHNVEPTKETNDRYLFADANR
jgi:hypothetical protein